MIAEIPGERILSMTDREKRWLNNVKKAIYQCDIALQSGENVRDRCFPELCNAVDTAKTLHRSLRDMKCSTKDNKKRFIDFLGGVDPAEGGYQSGALKDARTGREVTYTFAGVVYAIRCMIHENENLNASEQPDYHILLDWDESPRSGVFAKQYADERVVLNAGIVLNLLRQRLAKFVTSIDTMIAFHESGAFNVTIEPPLASIKPGENFVYANSGKTT